MNPFQSIIGNDHPWTLEHVKFLSEKVHPIQTIYPNWTDLGGEDKRLTLKDGSWIKVATIDDVVVWSMTGDGAEGSYLDHEEYNPMSCKSEFCE